jgi:hypothetical protein
MFLRTYRLSPKTILRVGMVSLIAAMVSLRFLRRWTGMNPDVADGITGFLYGIAIATMLLSIWMRRHASR